jgi:hypothetical protein
LSSIAQAQAKTHIHPQPQPIQSTWQGEKTKHPTTKIQTKTSLNPKANESQSQKDVAQQNPATTQNKIDGK